MQSQLRHLDKEIGSARLKTVSKELGFRQADDLFEKIGLGERLPQLVARHLLPKDDQPGPDDDARTITPFVIAGTEGLLVSYAKCCLPIPYEPIVAFLSSGRGVVIHRARCGNLAGWHKQPDKWLPVTWKKDAYGLFTSEIRVEVQNRPGVLATVAASVADTHINIGQVSVIERDSESSTITLEVQVTDRTQLAKVIRAIRRMPELLSIERTMA